MSVQTPQPGVTIGGFLVEDIVHRGGMATLWRASSPDFPTPLLMKVPSLIEGEDPAAIVSFEMEQMILPRLEGPHVPKFVAAEFSDQPYLVMELIAGDTLYKRLPELPLPYDEVAATGIKIATALSDLHRQRVVHLDVKPSNIMFRETGEAVLIDFGLSHHDHLPDLMQEEFRVPYGTAPYMSPEQLRGIRNDPRSDIFALGVLLYFFSTGERPFGEGERLSTMRRRLWRDPYPPRALKADYPRWLQEIVLRCLEIEPAWRYPTAAQVAFDLMHADQVKLTARAEKLRRDGWATALRRRFNTDIAYQRATVSEQALTSPIVMVAIDLDEDSSPVDDALRLSAARLLAALPSARLACINVLKQGLVTLDTTLDEQGRNKHIDRMVRLRHWAEPLKLDPARVTVHVLEAIDAAGAIIKFAEANPVDQILIGARQDSAIRRILGSVSGKVATGAPCSVTIVRPKLPA